MKQEYCPMCGAALGTSLTSCHCGWRMLDTMPRQDISVPPPAGYIAKPEHDRLMAEANAEIARLREAGTYLLLVIDHLRKEGKHEFYDVFLMVKEGSAIASIEDARTALGGDNG